MSVPPPRTPVPGTPRPKSQRCGASPSPKVARNLDTLTFLSTQENVAIPTIRFQHLKGLHGNYVRLLENIGHTPPLEALYPHRHYAWPLARTQTRARAPEHPNMAITRHPVHSRGECDTQNTDTAAKSKPGQHAATGHRSGSQETYSPRNALIAGISRTAWTSPAR